MQADACHAVNSILSISVNTVVFVNNHEYILMPSILSYGVELEELNSALASLVPEVSEVILAVFSDFFDLYFRFFVDLFVCCPVDCLVYFHLVFRLDIVHWA